MAQQQKDQNKILIVDDEYFLTQLIRDRLAIMGHKVSIAENGQEALALLEKETLDLVLMDVMMPVMDGWEATKRIKCNKKLKHIPVIFLTARSLHEDHVKAHEIGASDYITKPFEIEDLISTVNKWLPSNPQ